MNSGAKRLAAAAGLAGATGAAGVLYMRLRGDGETEELTATGSQNGSVEDAAAQATDVAGAIGREVHMSGFMSGASPPLD